MSEIPAEAMGPKMEALGDDRRRRFAWLMACGAKNATVAAREAGYSDKADGAKVRAHGLMHNPEVRAAIEEASRCVLLDLAPMAIQAAKAILQDPKHSSHARIIETVLDRTGFFAKSEHTVKVEHSLDTKELEDLARRLAAENGIDPKRLLGVNTATNTPLVIEGEVVDVGETGA
jgi:hypothetical protein